MGAPNAPRETRRQSANADASCEEHARVKSHTDASARDGGHATASKGSAGGTVKAEANKAKGKREQPPKPDYHVACPRCKSDDTKFCYYNNYNIKQPRFYCKDCCRYWTEGGMLRNVRVGSGRRKTKKTKEKEAAAAAAAQEANHAGDGKGEPTNADGKRARAAAKDKGTSRSSKVARTTHKRDGSSDGSATEAEQGDPGNFGYGRRGADAARWHTNGSNAGSDTAVRGHSPTDDQGSAEGARQPAAPVGWGMDPAVARYMNTGFLPTGDENVQAQAAAAAAASAAIMSAATRWGMQFWNKSVFPYGGIPNSSSSTFPGVPNVGAHATPSTPVSRAALKSDALTHPTPLHPTAAAAAAYNAPSHPSSQGVQYSSLFQNPWAQFSEHNKNFHSNPAMFQAMQQQMFNQQMAAHFIQMQQLHGAMHAHPHGFGATTGATQPTAEKPGLKEMKTEAPSSEQETKPTK